MGTYVFEGQEYNFPDEVSQEEALGFIETRQSQQPAQPQRSPMEQQDMLFGGQQGDVGASTVDPLAEQDAWAPAKSPLAAEAQAAANPQVTTGQSLEADNTSVTGDMGYAALDEIGSFLGVGAEGWEALKRSPLGASLTQGLGLEIRDPGEGIQMFKEALRAAGIPQQQVDNAASRFGSNLVWNTILTGLSIGVGRAMMGKQSFYGPGGKMLPESSIPASEVGRYKIGRALGEKPFEQMGAAVGGTATQTLTENVHGEGSVESLVGYIPGMFAGSYGTRRLQGAWQWATRGRRQATEPIMNKFANPMQAKIAAEDRIARDTTIIDNLSRDSVVGSKAGGGVAPWNERGGVRTSRISNERAQSTFEESREWAEDTVRQVENRYWDVALDDTPVDTQQLIDNAMDLRDELTQTGTEFTTPNKFLDQIDNLEPAVPPQKIQGLIRDVYSEIRRVRKDPTFSGDKGAYRANLNKVEDLLRDAMENSSTHPQLLDDARAMTRNRKARFTDGPMGEAKYMEGQGTTTIDQGTRGGRPIRPETLDFRRDSSAPLIARTSDGPTQVQAAHEMLESLGVRSTLADDFENAIRADYTAAVQQTDELGQTIYDPRKAKQWMDKNAPNLGAWKSLLTDLQTSTAILRKNAVDKAVVRKSVIARIANSSDASFQTQVNNAFNSPRSAREIQDLTTTFSIDQRTGKRLPASHDNIEAWENSVVKAFVARSQGDGHRMMKLLEDPNWKATLKQAFINNPDRLKRLEQVVARSIVLAREGEKQDMRGLVRNAGILFGGVVGARLGTAISTGTIQVPGYTARAGRGLIGNFLNKVLPESPGDKLWWAIETPEGYNWMMSRVPDSLEGTRKLAKQGRRLMALVNTQTHEKERQWLDEWGVRPREQ